MKKRKIPESVLIEVSGRRIRKFLVPIAVARKVIQSIREFEIKPIPNAAASGNKTAPWKVPVQDLIDAHTMAGVALRGARTKENITQTALAAKLGIPSSNISEMESGKRPIGKKMARRLEKVLHVHYKVFL